MEFGIEYHGLILHLEEVIQASGDGGQDQLAPVVVGFCPIYGGSAVEVEFHHRKQRMLARVRLAGNPTVEDTQDVGRIETFLGRFDALRFAVGVLVELIGGGNVYAVI